jgi:hypothetical protein
MESHEAGVAAGTGPLRFSLEVQVFFSLGVSVDVVVIDSIQRPSAN